MQYSQKHENMQSTAHLTPQLLTRTAYDTGVKTRLYSFPPRVSTLFLIFANDCGLAANANHHVTSLLLGCGSGFLAAYLKGVNCPAHHLVLIFSISRRTLVGKIVKLSAAVLLAVPILAAVGASAPQDHRLPEASVDRELMSTDTSRQPETSLITKKADSELKAILFAKVERHIDVLTLDGCQTTASEVLQFHQKRPVNTYADIPMETLTDLLICLDRDIVMHDAKDRLGKAGILSWLPKSGEGTKY
jgi:hypothetical protein